MGSENSEESQPPPSYEPVTSRTSDSLDTIFDQEPLATPDWVEFEIENPTQQSVSENPKPGCLNIYFNLIYIVLFIITILCQSMLIYPSTFFSVLAYSMPGSNTWFDFSTKILEAYEDIAPGSTKDMLSHIPANWTLGETKYYANFWGICRRSTVLPTKCYYTTDDSTLVIMRDIGKIIEETQQIESPKAFLTIWTENFCFARDQANLNLQEDGNSDKKSYTKQSVQTLRRYEDGDSLLQVLRVLLIMVLFGILAVRLPNTNEFEDTPSDPSQPSDPGRLVRFLFFCFFSLILAVAMFFLTGLETRQMKRSGTYLGPFLLIFVTIILEFAIIDKQDFLDLQRRLHNQES